MRCEKIRDGGSKIVLNFSKKREGYLFYIKGVGNIKSVTVVNLTIQSVGWVLVASIRTKIRRKQK